MNNVFDIKRFGNYFLYDLRRAKNNYGLSLLLLGLMPVIVFLFVQFFNLIRARGFEDGNEVLPYMAFFISFTVVLLGAGAKIYGFVTEKKAGSDFLMLPASTLEKWLSLVLITCLVLPVIFGVLFFGSDALLSLFFPNAYGDSLLSTSSGLSERAFGELEEKGVSINMPAILFLNWCVNILTFTLGAVCFKKAKVAKTLLCVMGVSMLFSILAGIFLGRSNLDSDWFIERFSDPDKVFSLINWLFSIFYTVVIGGLLGGIYYRLRTLKH
ncbi:MAG: hypothetical protein K5910_06100 [Bacteroidales bacterium]|nr:hypothetical protein [Bacteroidales bacterium]